MSQNNCGSEKLILKSYIQSGLLFSKFSFIQCEKVSKARRSMFGSLRLAHGQTIDLVDQKIINAR